MSKGSNHKPKLGMFSFTCCQGCQFTVLFLDNLMELLSKYDVQYFHLLKEKNRDENFDIAIIEGAITTKREIEKLRKIRKKSKFVVALGACACHGGIPGLRNFIENQQLIKYVYNQQMLKDSVEAKGIDEYIKVDYYLRGCPIIKDEFVRFLEDFAEGHKSEPFKGPVCNQCPKRGNDCFLLQKVECMGPLTHGGCNAICTVDNFPCTLCRGPLPSANFAAEIKLFENFGLTHKDVINKLSRFKVLEEKECCFIDDKSKKGDKK